MDGTITFSKGVVYWTTEKTNSDEFVFFCLEQFFGRKQTGVKILREAGKKPVCSPKVAEFSVTHTTGFLAAAVSTEPVGIDVENLLRFKTECNSNPSAPPTDFKRIAKRFFNVSVNTEEEFFYLWTAREAAAKRGETFLLSPTVEPLTTAEYFKVGDFLIAVCSAKDA